MRTNKNSGFTLIELVIVIAIIGILATAVLSGTDFLDQRNQATDIGNYNIARNLQAAVEQYIISGNTVTQGTNVAIDAAFLNLLKSYGTLKANFNAPAGIFTYNYDGTNYSVNFSLASTKFKLKPCTVTSVGPTGTVSTSTLSAGSWRVPDCQQPGKN